MQKRRFDLRQLREGRIQDLRDRAGRLRSIQSLGAQVSRVRQVRPRAEYIVPAICLLVLALALSWNALAPSPDEGQNASTTTISGTEIAAAGTPFATPNAGGLGPTPSPVFTGVTGYPAPEGIGTPVAGGEEMIPTFEPDFPPITDTTTADDGFLTPTPPDFSNPPLDPGTGYPGTDQFPQPGQEAPAGEVPTDDPNGGFDFPTTDPNQQPDFNPPAQFPTDPPFPTDEPFPTDPPFPTDEPFPGDTSNQQPDNQAYPPPADQVPTDEPFPTDAPFPDEETPVTNPDEPFPTDPAFPTEPGATSEAPAEPTAAIPPTATVPPTPTSPPPPTATPAPTVTPTPDPAVLIQGNVRWPAQGPITISQNHVVTAGSTLTIDPGVEVRIKPGVKLFVEGTLHSAGVAGNPVRIMGLEGRWNSIIGQPGSAIVLEHTEIRNAGRTGLAISSNGGTLSLRNVTLTDGGGGILADGATVDIRNSQITGNDLPTSQPLFVRTSPGGPVTLQGNIIGGNQLPNGTSNVRIAVGKGGGGPLDIQGNAFTGGSGPLLDLQAEAAVGGTIRCNAFRSGSIGLQLSSSTPSADGFGLAVDTNAFEGQSVYGVASTIALEAGNNWWGDPSGPGDAKRNPQGQGVRVGVNVGFTPQLQARPACAPTP